MFRLRRRRRSSGKDFVALGFSVGNPQDVLSIDLNPLLVLRKAQLFPPIIHDILWSPSEAIGEPWSCFPSAPRGEPRRWSKPIVRRVSKDIMAGWREIEFNTTRQIIRITSKGT